LKKLTLFKVVILFIIIVISLFGNLIAIAEGNGEIPTNYQDQPINLEEQSFTPYRVFNYIFVTFLIIGTSYIALKIVNRKQWNPSSSFMRIIDRLPLCSNSYIALIEIGPEIFLLGVTNEQITVLQKVEDGNFVHLIKQHHDMAFKDIKFAQVLTDWLAKTKVDKEPDRKEDKQ
jgi:flagellar biogenesis protein FliO